MEILILFGLILLIGVFAMSEIAIVTASSGTPRQNGERRGTASAAIALKLGKIRPHFLSAVQIGITSTACSTVSMASPRWPSPSPSGCRVGVSPRVAACSLPSSWSCWSPISPSW